MLVAGFFFWSAAVSAAAIGQGVVDKPMVVAKAVVPAPKASPAAAAPEAPAPAPVAVAAAAAAAAPAPAADDLGLEPLAPAPAAKPAAAAPPPVAIVAPKPAAAAPAVVPAASPAAPKAAVVPAVAVAPAAAPPAAPKPAVKKLADDAGALNLKSDYPADVFVDGRKVGKTPLVGYRVNAGNYKVRFDCVVDGTKVPGTAKSVNVPSYSDVDVDHECSADKPAE
ncbi:MAG: PEGA domain-containing protein [Myxococcaceae bacterium]